MLLIIGSLALRCSIDTPEAELAQKYHEIQLRLPNSKFVMIPIFEPLILNSHCTKRIVRKNVWKLNLETITMTAIVFCHSYILDVQIFSSNKL